jgi:hypothetical protein
MAHFQWWAQDWLRDWGKALPRQAQGWPEKGWVRDLKEREPTWALGPQDQA